MTLSRLFLSSVLAVGAFTALPAAAYKPAPVAEHYHAPERIQVALLLDTSNSMDGLIAQAKSQLWMLVNELAEGEKQGRKPQIELALYEYGNSNISVSKGYIRQVLPLTTDLDGVSERLFSLKTDGGQEYAGQVMMTALEDLEWSRRREDLKLIIIAGNEPFTQGPVDYRSACDVAHEKGVIIDTIHCGNERTGIETKWKAGADCGHGIYMTINQDEESLYIESPYDDDILRLNKKLNETYIGYGAEGRRYKERQALQDSNAAGMSVKSSIARAKSKASAQYRNESWDIVDAYEADSEAIIALPEAAVPEEMKGMDAKERKAFVEEKKAERERIQAEITALEQKREAHVDKVRAEEPKTKTLEDVMVGAVRGQAKKNGWVFKE